MISNNSKTEHELCVARSEGASTHIMYRSLLLLVFPRWLRCTERETSRERETGREREADKERA
jgi:hypothetical protein